MRPHALSIVAGIALAGSAHAAVELRTLGGPDDPLRGECERCAEGDYLLDNGALEVAVGASHRRDESFYRFATADAYGSIVFCRPRGSAARGDIMLGTPYLRIGNTTHHLLYDEIEVEHSAARASIRASSEHALRGGARLRFEARYQIDDASPRIGVRLRATNIGSQQVDGLIHALFFDPHQIYDFSPADYAEHRALAFRGYPRASHLLAWLDPTPRVAASDGRYGWDGGMLLPDPVSIRLEPGESDERRYALVAGSDSAAVLARVYRETAVDSHRVRLEIESSSRDYIEVSIREAGSQAIFYRAFRDRPEPLAIELPAGEYVARASFFPGVDECSFTVPSAGGRGCALRDPPLGRARFRIADGAGRFVPGKLSFHGVAPTRSPYFRPVNPAYDDGYWESYKNSAYPEPAGSEIALPLGRYRVVASRGPEYAIDERIVTIDAGRVEDLAFRIDRAIDRPDLVSMDSHLHTLESDGSVDIAEKVKAIVAEGVEVAIATDHNFPVDYRPALAALGLDGELTAFTGAEVTVPERLDYNTYPMRPCTEAPVATCRCLEGDGAEDGLAPTPCRSPISRPVPTDSSANRDSDTSLDTTSRNPAAPPGCGGEKTEGDWGSEPEGFSSPQPSGAARRGARDERACAGVRNRGAIDALSTDLSCLFHASRARDPGVIVQVNHPRSWQFDYFAWHGLDPESAAFANEGFDLSFDVLEVVNGPDYDAAHNRAARNDWLNLLRRGYFFPLVGTSDSHEIDRDEPGYSRTYLYREPSRADELDAAELAELVRRGRSFASNGPLLDITVDERYRPGDTLSARGNVRVAVDVWSARWIEVSQLQLYVNGEPRSVPMREIAHATARHLRAELELELDRDSFLVAEARGTQPLFPVVQALAERGGGNSVLPYALTNPIFIDRDGNGRFDPPLPHRIELRRAQPATGPLM